MSPQIVYCCPTCNSQEIQKVSVAYSAGTITTTSKSTGTAVGFAGGKMIPVLSSSTSSGVQQTHLASTLSPPEKNNVAGTVVGCGLGSGCMFFVAEIAFALIAEWLFGSRPSDAMTIAAGVFATIICLVGLIAVVKSQYNENTNVWPKKYREWDLKWICLRCGSQFNLIEASKNTTNNLKANNGTPVVDYSIPTLTETPISKANDGVTTRVDLEVDATQNTPQNKPIDQIPKTIKRPQPKAPNRKENKISVPSKPIISVENAQTTRALDSGTSSELALKLEKIEKALCDEHEFSLKNRLFQRKYEILKSMSEAQNNGELPLQLLKFCISSALYAQTQGSETEAMKIRDGWRRNAEQALLYAKSAAGTDGRIFSQIVPFEEQIKQWKRQERNYMILGFIFIAAIVAYFVFKK